MAITHGTGGTMFTGDHTRVYQLIAVKSALKLEKLGMRHSKLGSIRKPWALKLGLKANAKIDDVIAAVEKRLEEVSKAADSQEAAAAIKKSIA